MGKTYKTIPEELFSDDFSDYDLDELDYDDEIDSLLLDSPSRRNRNKRAKRNHADKSPNNSLYKLPSDWHEFDFSPSNGLDDWR